MTMKATATPALMVRGITKNYGAIRALDGVDLDLHGGEVLALVGDNGAGKSTLVKCIAGAEQPDAGDILVDGEKVRFGSAQDARETGIETVHQDLALVDTMDVVSNLFLNREILHRNPLLRAAGWLDRKQMRSQADAVLSELRIRIPSTKAKVEALSGGQRQAVAVGRAAAWGRHIVLMDEPTAALGVEQSRHVYDLLHSLRDQGVGILFISHNMHDVMQTCDRAVVLRHGRVVGDLNIDDIDARRLVDLITGVV